ncbi:MAG TPA: hypothetical protein VKQ72_08475, partial [Aggregatilineales bacterium]|nr:hypothetical protein [Aggregatilineales bacterium]
LFGKKTTALLKTMELGAWIMTRTWMGSYYRTYPQTVEDEVIGALAAPGDFLRGPLGMARDSLQHLEAGFTVLDGNYLSARWPGDAHRFGTAFAKML